jgi:hypothetical protein
MIDIVKLANGNVAIYDSTSGDFINSLSPDIVEIECNVNGSVKVVQDNGSVEYIDPAQVANTEVVPAAPIAFSGTCADLAQLLSTDFFFVVSGGGVTPTLTQVLTAGDSAGSLDITDLNLLDFDTATTSTAGAGQMAWNSTDGTLDLGMQGGLKNKIGHQLFAKVRNNSGSAITKGSVVKVVGVAGGFIGIDLALGDSDANSSTAFGIVAEDIADASNGFVAINGIIHGLNTNAFTEGDILYISPTVAGAFTNIKPVAPLHAVVIGYVAKKSATDGHILLHVQNGYELDELHDVAINSGTLANKDILQYNSSSLVWENKKQPIEIQLAASDETTALTTGTAKVTFRLPVAFTLTGVRASLTTAQASGSIFTVDINQSGSSVLGTKLTIDNTEKTSVTAATAATITTSALTDDAEITIDIDQIGNGTATGLKITLIGTR